MDAKRYDEITELMNKILSGKYKCGMAADSAIRELWDECGDLRSSLSAALEQGEIYKRIIEVDDSNEIARLRTELDAALTRAEKAEGALCSMKEALQGMEVISNLWLPAVVDEEHRGEAEALHSAREKILAALSSSAPCVHASELERVTEWTEQVGNDWREAGDMSKFHAAEYILAELRRRAGGE